MKLKKFVIFLLSAPLIYLIFTITSNSSINYLALGDGLAKGTTPFGTISSSYTDYLHDYFQSKNDTNEYYKIFAKEDYRIPDLTNDILNIESFKSNNSTTTITQAIKNADIITISIGSEELFYKIKQNNKLIELGNKQKIIDYIDEMFRDMDYLLEIMRKITNKPIIIIGYYNPLPTENNVAIDSIFNYIDLKFKEIIDKNMYYIDIYQEFKDKSNYLPNPNSVFPSLEGYNYITNEIIKIIEEEKLI